MSTDTQYDFLDSAQGWTFVSLPGVFGTPAAGHLDESLYITATNNTNNFGYWLSPTVGVAADKLYCAVFGVRSSESDRSKCPSVRFRFNTVNAQVASVVTIDSVGAGNASPPANQALDYHLFFAPPPNAVTDGIVTSVDLLNFDYFDSADATLYIEDVTILKTPLPLE
jgi:hypothetical protein